MTTKTDGPRPDAPDTERTDTAAFTEKARVELELGREEQDAEMLTAEDDAEPDDDNAGANNDDATPEPEPDAPAEPEPDGQDAGDAA